MFANQQAIAVAVVDSVRVGWSTQSSSYFISNEANMIDRAIYDLM